MTKRKDRIGIDIDGVLSNVTRQSIIYARDNFGIEFKESDITEYSLHKTTRLTESQVAQMLSDPNFYADASPFPFARLSTKIIFEAGFDIHLVTARPPAAIPITINWLRQNGIYFSFLKFEPNKADYASAYKLDYFVEDKLATAISLAPVVYRVYLVDTLYNQGETPENVKRVDSLSGILGDLARIELEES